MIENIVFDMGNVLIDYDAHRYVREFTDEPGDSQLMLEEVFASVEWVRQDRGSITEEEAVASISQRLPQRLHSTVRALFENWHKDIPPFPEMEELIAALKGNGYGIYLLSNTGIRYHEFRKNIPALQYFDGEFISADWHLLKPCEAIFLTFCTHFSLQPQTCFFIDDYPANIESAQRVGMQGFIFRKNMEKLRATLHAAGVRL